MKTNLLFVFISSCISFLLVELSLLVFAPIPYHQIMAWEADGHIKGRGHPNQKFNNAKGGEVLINSFGFRGLDPRPFPDPGTLRIVVFAGSSGFCYHAKSEAASWPKQLQSELSDLLNMPVEVINLSLPGFDMGTSKINYMNAGRYFHPHVAIAYHTWNDLKFLRSIPNDPSTYIFANTIKPNPWWGDIVSKSQIARRFRLLLYRYQDVARENHYTTLESENVVANLPVSPESIEWFQKNFRDFVLLAISDITGNIG